MKPVAVFSCLITLFLCSCQHDISGKYLITDITYSNNSLSSENIEKTQIKLLKKYVGSTFKIDQYESTISIKHEHHSKADLFKELTNNTYVMLDDDDVICEIRDDELIITDNFSGEVESYVIRKIE